MGWSARASLLLLAAMVCAPFLEPRHYPLFRHFYGEWLAAALGLAACVAMQFGEAARAAAVPRVIVVPIGLVAVALLQLVALHPTYPSQTLVFMLYLVWAGMLAVLGHALAGAIGLGRVALAVAWGVLVGGLLGTLAGLMQFADVRSLAGLVFTTDSVMGNLAQRNHFANQLWLACAAAVYLFAERRLGWTTFVSVAVMLLSASILSASRSVSLHLMAVAVLSFVWHRRAPDGDTSRRLLSGALALLCLFAALDMGMANLYRLFPGANIETSLARLVNSPSDPTRLRLWTAALEIFSSAPLLGAGVGQFSWQTFLAGLGLGGVVAEHSHNVVMQLLAELGLFATLLVAGGLFAWLVRVLRTEPTAERWLALALLAVISIHSMLEYPLWYTFFLGPFALMLGAADPAGYTLQSPRLMRASLAAMMLVGGLFLANAMLDYASLREGVLPLIRPAAQGAPVESPERLAELRRNVLFTAHIDLRLAAAMPVKGGPLKEQLALCNDALRFYPIWQVAYKCALLLALDSQAQQAEALWRQAVTVFPDVLPAIVADLRRMPEARDGALAGLRSEGEKALRDLRARNPAPGDRNDEAADAPR